MSKKLIMSPAELRAALRNMPDNIKLDVIQLLVDLVGIAEPTGTADAVNAFISLCRGDLLGAAVSVVSVLPFGDAAKAMKLPKYAKSLKTMVRYAARRPALAKQMVPTFRKLADILLQAKRIALKGGDFGADIARQLTAMRNTLTTFVNKYVKLEKFGAAKMARKNGSTVAGAHIDVMIRGSRITHKQVVDILEAARERSTAVKKGIDELLERMALADKWELRAHIHRSKKSEMNQHFNILMPDERQIHVVVDAKGNFVRASTLSKNGKNTIYLTPELGTQARDIVR